MIYEIILTDKCNRLCNFCNYKKGNYIENINNIELFCNFLKTNLDNKNKKISLFGGEPLLNKDGIDFIVSSFKNDQKYKLLLTTNGDFISQFQYLNNIENLSLHISAYDIFDDLKKYESYVQMFNNKKILLSYTFTSNDVNRYLDFVDMCKNIDCQCKPVFSHSYFSWKDLSYNDVYHLIYSIFFSILKRIFIENRYSIIQPIEFALKRIIEYLYSNSVNYINCISRNRKIFYKGKMHFGCILVNDIEKKVGMIPNNCVDCKYVKICSKSCMQQLINNRIPKQLCAIEKAQIESTIDFISQNSQNAYLKQILQNYLDDICIKNV